MGYNLWDHKKVGYDLASKKQQTTTVYHYVCVCVCICTTSSLFIHLLMDI